MCETECHCTWPWDNFIAHLSGANARFSCTAARNSRLQLGVFAWRAAVWCFMLVTHCFRAYDFQSLFDVEVGSVPIQGNGVKSCAIP